jgi:hypothetical protein
MGGVLGVSNQDFECIWPFPLVTNATKHARERSAPRDVALSPSGEACAGESYSCFTPMTGNP